MKRCSKCGTVKPLDDFYVDRAKTDGRDSWCKADRNEARRGRYYANHDHELERCRNYYSGHREQKRAYGSRYYWDHREELLAVERARSRGPLRHRKYDPQQGRINYLKRHGGADEFARRYAEQDGNCYLCGGTLEGIEQKYIHVDHDHECCPGTKDDTRSCQACRRGLAHAWCNQIIGLCGEDMDTLRAIIANFEPARDAAKSRIVTAKASQPQLMPHLEMPTGVAWPQADTGMLL